MAERPAVIIEQKCSAPRPPRLRPGGRKSRSALEAARADRARDRVSVSLAVREIVIAERAPSGLPTEYRLRLDNEKRTVTLDVAVTVHEAMGVSIGDEWDLRLNRKAKPAEVCT